MRARMKSNLISRYQLCPEFKYFSAPFNELLGVKEVHGWLEYFNTKLFLKSIEGKVVNLVFTCGDAFEEKDNNFWLPNSLWDEV